MIDLNRNSDVRLDPPAGSPGAPTEYADADAAPNERAGAAAGMVEGPVGMAVGPPLAAAAVDLAGTIAAVDASAENRHWRNQFRREPYYLQAYTYGDYAPAFLTGYQGYARLAGSRYDSIEGELKGNYAANCGSSALTWLEARPAIRAAWDRVADRATKPIPQA